MPWNAIVGMRHRVVHDYTQVDLNLVWDVVTKELAELAEQLEVILSQ